MNSPILRDAIQGLINPTRRSFLKTAAAGTAAAGLFRYGLESRDAHAFAYEPYPRDDELTTVVTSCAHNCGSRHMLVAHKKGDVIVRLSTDDGRYQEGGAFGKDTDEEPQLRACLRGRSYRSRLYSAERLLYPMMRVGERGEGKFKRVSWDEALSQIAKKMVELKTDVRPDRDARPEPTPARPTACCTSRTRSRACSARFLGMFGCRTNSWSVPSYQGTTFSSRMTFGTIEDGNEDDAFAHSKLIIMWGWNPAYTFHGGNTFYYMRMAKQRGCKFVVVDPQYTDSAAAYDAWWIPIKPNTDAAMLAGMAHYIFANNLQDQTFIDKFCQGMDAGTMPDWAKGKENFKDYILGKYDGRPRRRNGPSRSAASRRTTSRSSPTCTPRTKPAALKASWSPGRNAYGEQYNRMAAALQAMTGNIGVLGGCAEGVGKALARRGGRLSLRRVRQCLVRLDQVGPLGALRAQLPERQARGDRLLAARRRARRPYPEHQGDLLAGLGLVQPAHQHQQGNRGDQEAGTGGVHGFDHHALGPVGRRVCCPSPPTSSATTWRCPGTRGTTTSTGPRSSSRWARARPTSRSSPNWPIASRSSTHP